MRPEPESRTCGHDVVASSSSQSSQVPSSTGALMPRRLRSSSRAICPVVRGYYHEGDSSQKTNLTNKSDAEFLGDWSPEGTKVMFQEIRDGNQEAHIMDDDGSNQTKISNNAAAESLVIIPTSQ